MSTARVKYILNGSMAIMLKIKPVSSNASAPSSHPFLETTAEALTTGLERGKLRSAFAAK